MVNWHSNEGATAIALIKEEIDKGNSYREIALLINSRKIFSSIVTSEQIRSAKRYHIDKQERKKKKSAEQKMQNNIYISEDTKELVKMFQSRIPVIKEMSLSVDRSKPGVTTKTEEMVLLLSGCNVTNLNFKERINEITKKIKELHYKQTATAKIEKLNVFMLGDMVVGLKEIISKEYDKPIDEKRIDNMYEAVSHIAEMLISLLISFKKIHITSICNVYAAKQSVNWDLLFYKALEKMLINYKDRITFDISPTHWSVKSLYGHKFLLSHESEIAKGYPIIYGSYKTNTLLREIQSYKTKDVKDVSYVCTADNHDVILTKEVKEHIQNGSFKNENMQPYWNNHQYLFAVGVDGITWRYKI